MFGDHTIDRRSFVKSTAAATLFSTVLAGCTGGGGGGGGDNPTPTEASGSGQNGKPSFSDWMENVGNYDSVVNKTGSDEVTVTVGAKGNDGNFAFDPPAIRISTGTTVVWKWNGKGGTHNVHAMEGADFKSKLTDKEGFTFEHTFQESGTVKYQCDPHVSMGMKGVVVVK